MIRADAPTRLAAARSPLRTGLHARDLALSITMHAAVLGLLWPSTGHRPPPAEAPLEIEILPPDYRVRGAPATAATPPMQAEAPTPDTVTARAEAPAVAPSPPSPPLRDPARPAPEVNLGNADEDLETPLVTGRNVVPASPDSRFRNLPPHYPAAAARAGIEGVVQIVAQIMANGVPSSVVVGSSSGNAELDAEARRAVQLWRFKPAQSGGHAVPFEYAIDITFSLGSRS